MVTVSRISSTKTRVLQRKNSIQLGVTSNTNISSLCSQMESHMHMHPWMTRKLLYYIIGQNHHLFAYECRGLGNCLIRVYEQAFMWVQG